ncbi:hypothetical protein G155_00141 [Mycobacterium sp. VKM Ac-1817D]|nr:hypothetical protein G155_00141 [Mycobacterium sp. VKM Ac-1817D]
MGLHSAVCDHPTAGGAGGNRRRIFINWTDQGQLNRWPSFRCPVSTCVTVC